MSTESEQTNSAYAATINHQLEHEDSLMVNRLSWLVASQAFLFTAYAITLNGASQPQSPVVAMHQNLLQNLLPALGLTACGLIYLGVLAGVRLAVVLRRKLWERRGEAGGAWEPILASATTHVLGLVAPLVLPPVFFAAWATVLLLHR